MQCNVGGAERIGRGIVGVVLLLIGFMAPVGAGWQIVLFVLAAIALLTAIVQYCPVNSLLGINTCKRHDAGSAPGSS